MLRPKRTKQLRRLCKGKSRWLGRQEARKTGCFIGEKLLHVPEIPEDSNGFSN